MLNKNVTVLIKMREKVMQTMQSTCNTGKGGYSTNVYSTERLRPEVQPLTLLYTSFHEKLLSYTFY